MYPCGSAFLGGQGLGAFLHMDALMAISQIGFAIVRPFSAQTPKIIHAILPLACPL